MRLDSFLTAAKRKNSTGVFSQQRTSLFLKKIRWYCRTLGVGYVHTWMGDRKARAKKKKKSWATKRKSWNKKKKSEKKIKISLHVIPPMNKKKNSCLFFEYDMSNV